MDKLNLAIPPVENKRLEKEILERLNNLTKPIGSLGRLEDFVLRYCLCRGSASAKVSRMKLFTFAGDHGITEEKITPYPSEVTYQMVLNMAAGGAAISVMCRKAGIDCAVVDMGVKGRFQDFPGLLIRKIAPGTRNFRKEPAMTDEECMKAIDVGQDLAKGSASDLLGVGEMGIGNTSSASALYSLLLDLDPEDTIGAGTGSIGPLLEKKKQVVRDAVLFHRREWDRTPLEALRRVGGFEIAGMTGMILGGAVNRIPVVIDGFVATAAALVAMKTAPAVKDYLFFAHASAEQFHKPFLASQGIEPILSLNMRLGEGTGSLLAMQIIAQAMECYHQMATFDSAGVSGQER
ncbi:MAG: nicotinate-nucleotide--dimethylbenzimidazole phosphoribosyltransferase [Desulfobacterota bacterium]|jgi:nicotinate-nucleotide--dimethylbenzimidazole phosphoribosyltransferase|nr:nicotinate-nucleotide--dimethylbenzimidazole phosphoribosyltransferase [Thermodesulfobacteriota bacterium]